MPDPPASPSALAKLHNPRWTEPRHIVFLDTLLVWLSQRVAPAGLLRKLETNRPIPADVPDDELLPFTRLGVSEPPRHGKALALDTPIPTPTGWVAMGDLRVGDQVFSDTGEPCTVIGVSPVWRDRPVYSVRTDDGDEIIADEEHEWMARLDYKHPARIQTTKALARPRGKRAMIRRQGPLALPDEALPIDPYVLGAWLGDGTSAHATITQGAGDIEWLRGEIERLGHPTRDRGTHSTFGVGGMQTPLRQMGLLRNKHIPTMYLRAGIEQRRSLLQGLVDTDGYVAGDGQVEVCLTNERLARDVHELVCSLGRKASIIYGRATIGEQDFGPKYRVMFYMAGAARMPRKAVRCRDVTKTPHRYVSAAFAGYADTMCIEVDSPTHLFLAGRSMLPTHNSEMCSRYFPAWYLGTYPHHHVILTSYGDGFAKTWGRKARNVLEALGERCFGIRVSQRTKAANDWEIEGHEGGMMTAGTGGGITGRGANLAVGDDLVRGAKDAASPVIQGNAWDWWQSELSTRLEIDGDGLEPIVLIPMTRWNEGDILGRILSNEEDQEDEEQWFVLRMPALAEENDPLGRQPGEALWPERRPLRFLQRLRDRTNAYWWSALYQQRPTPLEGDVFRRSTWQFYDEAPPIASWPGGTFVDTAGWKDVKTADFAASATVLHVGKELYWLNAAKGRWTFNQLVEHLIDVYAQFPLPIYVEDVAWATPLVQVLRDRVPGVVPMPTGGIAKTVRAIAASPYQHAGNFHLPRKASWTKEFIDEHAAFPNGAHDDQVDTTSMAAIRLLRASLIPLDLPRDEKKQNDSISVGGRM